MEIVDRLNVSAAAGKRQNGVPGARGLTASSNCAPDCKWALLDHLSAAIVVLDREGRIVHLNAAAEQRLAREATSVVGRDLFREVLPGLEEDGLGERYRTLMQGNGATLSFQTTLAPPGDAPEPVVLSIQAFQSDEQLVGVVSIERRPPHHEASRVERARLEHLAVVGELTGGVAHQINNPLASIKGFAQLLARDLVGTTHGPALDIIEKECSRISGIIDNLLQFARTDDLVRPEAVDLNSLVERTLALQEYALTTMGISVHRDLAPDLSPVLVAPGALQRALLALLYNAERVLCNHSEARQLTMRTRESTNGVILCVQDNGPGRSREDLLALFQTSDSAPAAGCLSLPAAARAVTEQAGEIWAEAAVGRGTAIFLRLPRQNPSPARAPSDEHPRLPHQRSTERRKLRVLVADDEQTLHLALSQYLGRFGHEVTPAKDVDTAIRLATEQRFDVALVDVRMPGDGLVLLQHLETMPTLRGRIVLMSGDPSQARVNSGHGSGCPFLHKPFDMSEVVSLIEELGK